MRKAVVKDIGNSGLEMTIGHDNNSQEVEEGKDGKDDTKVDGNTEDMGKNIYFHEREHVRAGRNLGFTKNKCASVVVSSAVVFIKFQDLLGVFQHF